MNAVKIGLLDAQGPQVELVKNSMSIILSPASVVLNNTMNAVTNAKKVNNFFIVAYLVYNKINVSP
jgi:hypothetical protein